MKKGSTVRICQQCGREFKVYPSVVRRGGGRYCSRICFGMAHASSHSRRSKVRNRLPVNKSRRPQEGANLVDLTGQRYWHLVVLQRAGSRGTAATWLCQCDCGQQKICVSTVLRLSGPNSSCGCGRKTGKGSRPIYTTSMPPGESARNIVLKGYQHGAQKRGLAWELSERVFNEITKSQCFYCGQHPSTVAAPSRNGSFIYNGIDRIDNRLGYILGNVVSCCPLCNHAKRDMPQVDFFAWIERLIKTQMHRRE